MTSEHHLSLQHARGLHRSGQLEAARRAYEELLEASPGDADVEGLLGVLALQEGRQDEAERRLRRSLADAPEPRIGLRNLNNLVVLLRETDRGADARALLEGATPEWPEDAVAGCAEVRTVRSLVEAMLGYGQAVKARRLLDRALPNRAADAEALNLDGRLQLAEGDPARAATTLARAAELAPDSWQPLLALSAAQELTGDKDEARRSLQRLTRAWPVHAAPARPRQKATLLVLNSAPQKVNDLNGGLAALHYGGNYPSEISVRLRDEYRFLSVFADTAEGDWRDGLPTPDVVVNNLVNSEKLNVPGRIEKLKALVEGIPCPVINAPEQVFETTRQRNALLLQGVPNLHVPRVERYRTDLASTDDIVADIGTVFDYPVILRRTTAHMSADSLLADHDQSAVLPANETELREHLQRSDWQEFYAIEFVDLKRGDGFYRKLRAMIMDDEIIIGQASMNRQWMVSGWRDKPEGIDFYRAHPRVVEECNRIVLDPVATLGQEVMDTLKAARARVPLDLYGIDFEVDRNGCVVLFEASAAMIFHGNQSKAPEDVRLPAEISVRIDDAFRAMVARRLGSGN
jgi:Flp pilus assembly protein TadD/glutathione synthase/RimK-type ligase-like ATP-grasp enzyme